MTGDLTITGANDLAVVSAKMKRLGEGQLRREMLTGIRRAAKPLIPAARESALKNLPHMGGLNDAVATSDFKIRTRTSGSSLGVRVVSLSRRDLEAMDQGEVKHPVYATGPRKSWHWTTQQIKPGWFSNAMHEHADGPRHEVIRVINDIARRT